MGITVSILLAAAGAILAFAVNADVGGVNLNVIGWILLVVGVAGALLSMTVWSSWGASGYHRRPAHDDR
jgi:hypothetical protein